VKFSTTRFGDIEVDDRDVFFLKEGLIGFPSFKRLIVLEHNPGTPFKWIQSVDEGDMAFVVIDPLLLDPDYPVDMLKKAIAVDDNLPKEIGAAVIAVVPPAPHPITVNLLAPVVLDPEKRIGAQIILNGTNYTTRHVLVQDDSGKEQSAAAEPAR
jgi:flagellar assembly factor FliW